MTQDNFRYRSFRKRESKKRQKERHGKYTDTNWWIGREDVLVRVNKEFCSTMRRRGFYSKEEKELLLHFLSLYRLPQLGHGSTAVFLQKATSEWKRYIVTVCILFTLIIPVEAREHGDEEGRRVEEEEAREEGAQPGECEEGGADQGEVEHGRGGLHGQDHGQW